MNDKNILASFTCLVKIKHPNTDTESDDYWMFSYRELFETLDEAKRYISFVFDDIYKKFPDNLKRYLYGDEYNISINTFSKNGELCKIYRYDFDTRKIKDVVINNSEG